ncbi:hypothetical protein MEA186_06323 [Mesorhizobium amorphae CCNWGS0123]|uniref:Uncharacterized protein n=1 Tax=Mesorhizobium amorphae CCNWGS0123 TaxID=1082933 RepID=G6Y5Q5_9HYPH|nr:hypothetical protein MEA186_06323 [Mesorhizobium amorphae CCNWGS0123]
MKPYSIEDDVVCLTVGGYSINAPEALFNSWIQRH